MCYFDHSIKLLSYHLIINVLVVRLFTYDRANLLFYQLRSQSVIDILFGKLSHMICGEGTSGHLGNKGWYLPLYKVADTSL